MPPERKEPKAPIPNAPLRVIGPSDVQQQRQIWAPVQLLYAISAGLPAHVAGGGIQSVTATTTAVGPGLTFTGSVTNVGNTFTFTGGGHGATTLAAPFTIPAVGATGSMSVTDGTAFGQGTAFLIPFGSTVDQQPYMGQVVAGGGTNTLTVITYSIGTYSAGGTIATGTLVTWGESPTITNNSQPSIVQQVTHSGSVGPMTITFPSTPNVGDWLYAAIMVEASNTLNIPVGWTLLGQAATSSGVADNRTYILTHQMTASDTASFTFTSASGSITLGWLADISGVNSNLVQFTIADATAQGFNVLTPPILPYLPNSLVLGFIGIRNGFYESTTTGWTLQDSVFNFGSQLAVVSGPPTTTNAILANITQSDLCVEAMPIRPPTLGSISSGGGGGLGITQINSQLGPFISVVGSSYIGISTLPNEIEVVNMGIQAVTGPSFTASNTGIVFTGPNVLQTAPNTFYISVAGAAGGGGSGAASYDSVVLADFPQHYWPLSDTSGTTAADIVGGQNGTYVGGGGHLIPIAGTTQVGTFFDGSTCYVTIPAAVVLSATFSVECVIVTLSSPSGALGIFDNRDSDVSPKHGAVIYYGSTSITAQVGTGTTFTSASLATNPSPFTGIHLIMTYDGVFLRFYVNGASSAAASTAFSSAGSSQMEWGRLGVSAIDYMFGVLAKCAIYGSALTQAQITKHVGALFS